MTDIPDINTVGEGDDYYHVEFRDEDQFETIRTPDWAENAAHSVSDGAEVRTGQRDESDEWQVMSVLIKKSAGEDTARDQAEEIVEKIET
jgi:hypothetical protein